MATGSFDFPAMTIAQTLPSSLRINLRERGSALVPRIIDRL
jgi:hypothetical protein